MTDATNRGKLRVALVLGAAVARDGRPSPALLRRATLAASLYKTGEVNLIHASGGAPGAVHTEAEAIAALCRDHSVPPQAILLDTQARNTRDNIVNALPILAEQGGSHVVIVTDPYHARRAGMIARAHGLRVELRVTPNDTAPRSRVLRRSLREYLAMTAFLLRHRLGGRP